MSLSLHPLIEMRLRELYQGVQCSQCPEQACRFYCKQNFCAECFAAFYRKSKRRRTWTVEVKKVADPRRYAT